MKYSGFYYALFQGTMKKALTELYEKSFAANTMRHAKGVYKKLVLEAGTRWARESTAPKAVVAYSKWYTPEKERAYPAFFKVDFEGRPYGGARYYRITRCPICAYAQRLGLMEIMPLLCELDKAGCFVNSRAMSRSFRLCPLHLFGGNQPALLRLTDDPCRPVGTSGGAGGEYAPDQRRAVPFDLLFVSAGGLPHL